MAVETVLTGAIAIIRVAGTVVGRMRTISVNENISRGEVSGIGTIFTIEAPPLRHGGTVSCDFYEVDFTRSPIANAIRRDVQTNQQFQDQLCLLENGVQIDIFRKIRDVLDDNGLVIPAVIPMVTLTRVLIDGDGFNIAEGAIAGHNQSFRFLDPILRRS
jgi:hypothetical protein